MEEAIPLDLLVLREELPFVVFDIVGPIFE